MAASKKGGAGKGKRGGAKASKGSAAKADAPNAADASTRPANDSSGQKFTSKMAFIKAHPGLSPGEVAEKGKAAGFLFDPKYVSTVRSIERKKAGAPPKRRGRKPGSTTAPKAVRAPSGGRQSKADFVRSLPFDMPVAEVVKKASAAGITLSSAHVHTIRTAERAKQRKEGTPRSAKSSSAKQGASKAVATTPSAPAGHLGREVAVLVLNHGYQAVQTALDGVRHRLTKLL
jgi:hypothetical protein